MPVRPHFDLSQDDDFVTLRVLTPYVRPSEAEVVVEEAPRVVHFYCKPYLLRLTLPGTVVDDERLRVVYDVDDRNGTFTISLPKRTRGEVFPDLDMVTRLLAGGALPAGSAGADMRAVSSSAVEGVYADDADDDDVDAAGAGVAGRGSSAAVPTAPVLGQRTVLDSDAAAAEAAVAADADEEEEDLRAAVEEFLTLRDGSAAASKLIDSRVSILALHQQHGRGLRGGRGGAGAAPGAPLIEVVSSVDFEDGGAGHSQHGSHAAAAASAGAGAGAEAVQMPAQEAPSAVGSVAAVAEAAPGGAATLVAGATSASAAAAPAAPVPAPSTVIVGASAADAGVGFNRRFDARAFFTPLRDEAALVLDLPLPHVPRSAAKRSEERHADEDDHFDALHVASDSLLRIAAPARGAPATAGASSSTAAGGAGAGSSVAGSGSRSAGGGGGGLLARDNDDDDDADGGDESPEDPIVTDAVMMTPWWVPTLGAVLAERTSGTAAAAGADASSSSTGSWSWTEQEHSELASLRPRELLVDGVVIPAAGLAPAPASAAASPAPAPAGSSSRCAFAYDAHAFPEAARLLHGLATVLFAYAYDHRVTGGEGSVESSWSVRTLSPLLSWLDDGFEAPPPPGAASKAAAGAASGHAGGDDSDGNDGAAVRAAMPGDAVAAVQKLLVSGGGGATSAAAEAAGSPATASRGPLIQVLPDGESEGEPSSTAAAPSPSASAAAAAAAPASSSSPSTVLDVDVPPHAAAPASVSAAAGAFLAKPQPPPPPHVASMLPAAAACVRRALVFPYLRRWDLAVLCLSDAATMLMCGRRAVLRAVLAVRRLLARTGGDDVSMHYLLNTLFLDDYVIWLGALPSAEADTMLLQAGAALSSALSPQPPNGQAWLHRGLPAFGAWRLDELDERADEIVAAGGWPASDDDESESESDDSGESGSTAEDTDSDESD